MDSNPFLRPVSIDDPDGFGAVAAAVRDWEPCLELYRPPRDALLYEPDGTLYAVCVGENLALRTDRRSVQARPGDLLVVPQAYALDAGPDVDLVALRYDGPPPDHFRERFIQVWGFEHIAAPDPGPPGVQNLIDASDARHRVPYAIAEIEEAALNVEAADASLRLVLGLSGAVRLSTGGQDFVLGRREVFALPPFTPLRLSGAGRVGILTLLSEPVHEARKAVPGAAVGGGANPEYRPTPPA